jgi:hypothetical protein
MTQPAHATHQLTPDSNLRDYAEHTSQQLGEATAQAIARGQIAGGTVDDHGLFSINQVHINYEL